MMASDFGPVLLCILAACGLVYLFPQKARYVWLLVCSYAFYIVYSQGMPLRTPALLQKWGAGPSMPAFLPPLAFLLGCTLGVYFCALAVDALQNKPLRGAFLLLGLLIPLGLWAAARHLGLLSHFPLYVGGIVTDGNGNGITALAYPLGLSFYTVQCAGYMGDVFCRRAKAEKNLLAFAAFIAFFPALFVGPTARAGQMLPQLHHPAAFDYDRITGGAFRILWGAFKKILIADTLGILTTYVLGATVFNAGPMLVTASLLFVLQVYMDFSGWCDVVLGFAALLGLDLGENFARPFAAQSFAGLWQRWFISLGGLLRDFFYTPFAKAKKPLALVGALCSFLLLAAWHGLSKDYLLWGLLTGLLFLLSRLCAPWNSKMAHKTGLAKHPRLRAALRRLWVYLLFSASMMLFASAYFEQPFVQWFPYLFKGWAMLGTGDYFPALQRAGLAPVQMALVAGGSALVLLVERWALSTDGTVGSWVRRQAFYLRWPLYLVLLAAILFFGIFPLTAGIYRGF